MVVDSQFIDDLNASSTETAFLNLLNSPSGINARAYIETVVLSKFGDALSAIEKNGKTYFQETTHQTMAHTLEERHAFIN